MNLGDLVKEANHINCFIKDEAFNDREMRLLMDRRDTLNSMATYLIPRSRADAAFLCNLIEEYAEFVGDEPALECDRTKAIDAIGRMAKSLRKYVKGEKAA